MEKMFMIALTPTMENGKIARWIKKESDAIKVGDIICEVETDKSSMEYESINEGTILKILVGDGDSAKVGDVIAIVGEAGEDISGMLSELSEKSSKSNNASSVSQQQEKQDDARDKTHAPSDKQKHIDGERILISPLARKIAEAKTLNIRTIAGSGPGGRIVKRDVENLSPAATAPVGFSTAAQAGENIEISVSGVREVIAKRLSESKFSAPHFYLKTSLRTERMVALRGTLNETLQKQKKSKLSMNAFFIKFVTEALKRNPHINSSWQGNKIVQFGSIDIGLAVDLGAGLLTPIVRNCAHKGIEDIDAELQALIEKVRDGSICAQEYTGATFTISNLGSFGVDEFTAIINPPGSAILAIGQNRRVPVVNEQGALEAGSLMTISLSCDHRVIDGSMAARFITNLKAICENPATALL